MLAQDTRSPLSKLRLRKAGMMAHICNLGILEVEAEGSEIWGHPWLYSKFVVILGYMKTLSNRKKRKENRRGWRKRIRTGGGGGR